MFYSTARWQKKRLAILKRDGYQCLNCKRFGRLTDASMVHHCIPFEECPQYKLSSFNLISLCNKCHEQMHVRSTHELTNLGEYWKKKAIPPSE